MSRIIQPKSDIPQVGKYNGFSIPTFYRAQTFRSRLEARWAVFMDVLDVRWYYEYEGFELESGRYVPDFWLPDLNRWLEIKPLGFDPWGKDAGSRDAKRCSEFQETHRLVIFAGSPDEQDSGHDWNWYENPSGYVAGDHHYLWCKCPMCGRFGIEFDGRGGRVCPQERCETDDKSYSFDDPIIKEATGHSVTWRFQ